MSSLLFTEQGPIPNLDVWLPEFTGLLAHWTLSNEGIR